MSENRRVSIRLTEEQKNQIKQATGREADALELTFDELEERIAPSVAPMIRKL